jgi:hypothetical protein
MVPPDRKVPDRECITVQSKKVMLTILWALTGFAVVIVFESGCKFKTGYHVSKMSTTLREWRCERGGGYF